MRGVRWASLWIAVVSGTAGAQTSATAILDRIDVNPRRPIDFHAIVLPETVYVGQQTTYQVAVMLSADARSRLRRNPEFLPPELKGLLAYELGKPTRVGARNYAGGEFEAHVFQRALFPVASGSQVVPAPQLTYALPQSSGYFSREERFVVRAESAAFIVKALPIEGRPDDFNGAVGVLKASVRIDTTAVRVGDPLVVTLRVQGTGNVKLFPRPTIELDWASAVPGSERIFVDSSGSLVRGTKEFDWILTPARDGRVRIPPLRYAYFDPYAERYNVAESAAVELSVLTGTLAVADDGEFAALLPLRVITDSLRTVVTWSGSGRPPTTWLLWLVFAMLVPVPWLWWSLVVYARRRRSRSGRNAVVSITTSVRESEQGARGAARTTRRTLLAALATRFAQNPQALVSRRHVARVLRRAGVTRETTRDVLHVLEQLDELGFASTRIQNDNASAYPLNADEEEVNAARRVTELLRRVESEALPHGRQLAVSTRVALWLLLGMPIAGGVMRPRPALGQTPSTSSARTLTVESAGNVMDTQALARDAYAHRAFTEAAERFRALAARQPHNPDLLTNWGTAAWAAGDTVHAVIAWQRAARLEPLAADLQERVSMLPAGSRGGIADVPMMPVRWLVRVSLVLWFAGWSLLGWRAWQQHRATPTVELRSSRGMRGTAQAAVVLSLVCAGAAWWGLRALDATALAVVLRPETMRIAPGTDADAMGGVATGDVVRLIESRDAWQHIVHADGRRGWLPVTRLVMLQAAVNVPTPGRTPVRASRDLPAR